MYEILAGNTVIYSDITPLELVKTMEPKLTLEDSASGSLTFTLPPNNIGYNLINCLTTEIKVKQDGNEIWRGRVISDNQDLWTNKKIVCEGELSYLVDSIQPPHQYTTANTTIRTFLEALIAEHNSQMGNDNSKKFTVGIVTVEDGDNVDDNNAINRYTNYETTLACINDKLVNRLGGHIRVQWRANSETGVMTRYIDYLKDYLTDASNQVIRFGTNLLDFSKNKESTKWVTAIVPRGKRLDTEEIAGLEAYTTVKTAAADTWHDANSIIVKNPTALATYGFICEVVDWDDVTDPTNLLAKAKKYLEAVQFEKSVLEVSAVDLHYMNPSIDSFRLLETVHCISDPHGMNAYFPVTKIELDLNNPSNTKYTLGDEVFSSLTSISSKLDSEVYNYINNTPGESAVLKSAKDNAKALIEGTADGGYASFIFGTDDKGDAIIDPTTGDLANPDRPTGIRVADAIDDTNATQRWLWTYGGLGHQTRNGSTWSSPNIAMTMDGHLVADMVTTGRILIAGKRDGNNNYNPVSTPGFLEVYNGATKIGQWNSDGIWLSKGSMTIGSQRYVDIDGTQALRYPFQVTDQGQLYAVNGEFSGTIYGSYIKGSTFYSKSSSNQGSTTVTGGSVSILAANDAYLKIYYSGAEVTFGRSIWVEQGSFSLTNPREPKYLGWAIDDAENKHGSDVKLKKNITDIPVDTSREIILGARPRYYEFKNTLEKGVRSGFIAQELRETLNRIGDTTAIERESIRRENQREIIYEDFIAHLVNTIQDLYKIVDKQQMQIDYLMNKS